METENDKLTQTVIDVVPVIYVTTIYVKLKVSELNDLTYIFVRKKTHSLVSMTQWHWGRVTLHYEL